MAAKPAKPAPAKKDAAPAAEGDAPKSNKKMIIIFGAVIGVLVLVIAGGAAWYFLKAPAGEHVEEKKVEVVKEPKFIALEHFVGNLQPDGSGPVNFAIEMSLQTFDPEMELKIKALMPEIRSKLNLLISSKTATEMASINGKKRLALQIKKSVNGILGVHAEGEGEGHGDADTHGAEHGAPEHATEGAPPATGHEPAAGHEVAAINDAVSAPVVAEAPVPDEPVSPDAKGVAAVLFTSFILAY
jgi:flagellar FliL protein